MYELLEGTDCDADDACDHIPCNGAVCVTHAHGGSDCRAAAAWRRRTAYTHLKVIEEGLWGVPPAITESLHECSAVADEVVFRQIMTLLEVRGNR